MEPTHLGGKIAVVTGATRGTGRGIARALAAAGATVYCTGRSAKGHVSPMNRPETVEQTVAAIRGEGGKAHTLQVDHTNEQQIRFAVDRIIEQEGKLDILVNDIWGGDGAMEWGTAFEETNLKASWNAIENCLYSHLATTKLALPALKNSKGRIICVTDGTNLRYRGQIYYDLVKNAVIRLAYAFHQEGKQHGVTAASVTPGFLRSEAMLDHFGVTEANWKDATATDPNFIASETPLFLGRALAAWLADPSTMLDGTCTSSWELGRRYGIRDADGTQPDWGKHWTDTFPSAGSPDGTEVPWECIAPHNIP